MSYFDFHVYFRWEIQEMKERQVLMAIESVAESFYGKTKDKEWLKVAIWAEKRLNALNKFIRGKNEA